MNEIFEKIYNDNNTDLNESSALFEKVYTEAEMLNEMNPKLRALLAAGLIGTASLGAASCSMPTDDPTVYEQPAPETTNPDDPGDNNGGGKENPTGGGEETVTEEQKQLNALLKIIDNSGLREEIKGAKNVSTRFGVVTDVAAVGGTAIILTKDGISTNEEEKMGEDAYTFAKGSTFYFVLKADFPDLNPDAFLAAL